jgi:hypothetical protein
MNRQKIILGVVLVAVLTAWSFPAGAWGPAARQAIVSTAMHVISKEGPVRLNKLDKEVMAGITAPPEVVAAIFPGLTTNPLRAVEAEMNLLAGARGSAVEPYLAFRLGALGTIVADMTGPLATSNSPYRKQYFADADASIGRMTLMASERKTVDPVTYFTRVQGLANAHRDMILKDYQEGAGFNGLAKAALSEDASRSVDAVADVWATILTGTAVHAGISEAQMREYVVSAMDFYVKRMN